MIQYFNTLKNLMVLFCLLGLLLSTSFLREAQAQESRLQKILESGVLRVGTTGDFKPMSLRDVKSGSYEGYDIDLVTELAKDMGVELELVATDWKTLVNGVLADKYDMTTSASISVARAKVAGYSDPYIYFGTVPMTLKKNVANLGTSWQELDREDITVATTLGTVFESQARKFFKKAKVVTVEAPAREYQEVLSGRADISLTSNVDAASLKEQYTDMTTINVDAPLTSSPGAFLVAQDDQVWLNFINHWIALKQATPFFRDLHAEWFGAN